jgi:hypothetical protein
MISELATQRSGTFFVPGCANEDLPTHLSLVYVPTTGSVSDRRTLELSRSHVQPTLLLMT